MKPPPKARAEGASGGAPAKKQPEKKGKSAKPSAKRPPPPRPPDGWLGSLQRLAALRDRAFREGATKSWRRLAAWSRGLLGL